MLLVPLATDRKANRVRDTIASKIVELAELARGSLTWDQARTWPRTQTAVTAALAMTTLAICLRDCCRILDRCSIDAGSRESLGPAVLRAEKGVYACPASSFIHAMCSLDSRWTVTT